MESHEIELITDEMMKSEVIDLFNSCAPGWCGPVDGFMLKDEDEDTDN